MSAILNKIRLPSATNKTPIVYILGWGGARDKQLSRYSKIYEDKNCNVTRYIPPFGRFSGKSFVSYEKFAHDFYNKAFIDTKEDVDRPIVFHAFSMNGISMFVQFWDLLSTMPEGNELKSRIKGFVFDSGPSDTVPRTSAIAFSLATFPPDSGFLGSIGRVAMFTLVFAYVSIFRSIQWIKYMTYDRKIFEREIAFYRMLKIEDFPHNQLYLYSKVDPMIRYKDVDKFIEHQKSLSANVKSKCWPDSPHIQHLRCYPEEYQKLCSDFMDKLIKKS